MNNVRQKRYETGTLFRTCGRRLVCASALLPVFLLVHYAAYWLRFDGQLTQHELNLITSTMLYVAAVKLVVFGWFRVYQSWSRYLTFHDLVTIVQASTVSSLLLSAADHLCFPHWRFREVCF